jgi:hypothetical protein
VDALGLVLVSLSLGLNQLTNIIPIYVLPPHFSDLIRSPLLTLQPVQPSAVLNLSSSPIIYPTDLIACGAHLA